MKKVDWQVKETFAFPVSAGVPKSADAINVTPRFTITRTEEAVRLTGIYHISATIKLNATLRRNELPEKAILIEDVDVQESAGYFEYAVPFRIDLPSEVNDSLKVSVLQTTCKMAGQGAFTIIWDVQCAYKDEVAHQEQIGKDEEKQVKAEQETKKEPAEKEMLATENNPVVKETQAKEVEKITEEKVGHEKESTEKTVSKETPHEKAKEVSVQQEENAKSENKALSHSQPEKEVAEEMKSEQVAGGELKEEPATPSYTVEDTTFSNSDEVLSFIAGLDDEITTSLFRSNDVTVQTKG